MKTTEQYSQPKDRGVRRNRSTNILISDFQQTSLTKSLCCLEYPVCVTLLRRLQQTATSNCPQAVPVGIERCSFQTSRLLCIRPLIPQPDLLSKEQVVQSYAMFFQLLFTLQKTHLGERFFSSKHSFTDEPLLPFITLHKINPNHLPWVARD